MSTDPKKLSDLGEAALEYTRSGRHVHRLWPNGHRDGEGELADKTPATSSGYKDGTVDQAKIRAWWHKMPDANIGIACGASGFVVLDIDAHKNGFESLAVWEKDHGPLPVTLTCRTPNGGEHRYFLADATVTVKSCSDLLPGVDIRGVDGYVVAPPSVVNDKPYRWINELEAAPLPHTLMALICGRPAGIGRNDYLAKVIAPRLRNTCDSEETLRKQLLQQNSRFPKPLSEAEVRKIASSAWRNYDAHEDVLGEMNAKHAVIKWKGRTLILTDTVDPTTGRPAIELSSTADMRIWFINTPPVGESPRFNWWLRHPRRRQFLGVVFEPQSNAASHYNLWRGWGVEPRAGDCSLWLALVRDVICGGDKTLYNYVLAWCADAVQNPTLRPGVVLVLRGPQGVGKGTFARTLGKLFGDHYLHIRHARHLTGNFNAHLANVLLLFADEAYFPGDRAGEGALKALITEPTIPLEYKGKDVISVNNYVRVVMASNSDWVVPAPWDDRRFTVLDITREHAQDTTYFGAINAQLEAGGYEALLHFLLHYPLGDVELRKIPDTQARREQQIQSLDSFQAYWLHWLEHPPTVEKRFISSDTIYESYAKRNSHYPMERNAFFMRFKKVFPAAKAIRAQRNGVRIYGYELPLLAELRKNFDDAFGKRTEWSPEPVEDKGLLSADTVRTSEPANGEQPPEADSLPVGEPAKAEY